MEPEKLKALKESIEKWKRLTNIETMNDINIGPENCALCSLYHIYPHEDYEDKSCISCPVYEKTGYGYCADTPYENVQAILDEWSDDSWDNYRKQFQQAANDEMEFLKSLLPESEK